MKQRVQTSNVSNIMSCMQLCQESALLDGDSKGALNLRLTKYAVICTVQIHNSCVFCSLQFDESMTVYDACRHIQEKVPEAAPLAGKEGMEDVCTG